MEYIVYFLKGAFIGGTMLIPGVSGGTMAMALGMYRKLISAVAGFRKNVKESLLLLLPFAAGGVLGAVLLSSPIGKLLEAYPLPVMFFFVGAIAGGVPMIFKKAFSMSEDKRFSVRDFVCIAAGAVVPVVINVIPSVARLGEVDAGVTGYAVRFAVGFVCALSLSLPGISTSYMLLLIGAYDRVLAAFAAVDVLYMLPMALGGAAGLLVFAKLMERLLSKHPRATYTTILGFILGSVVIVFPKELPTGAEWAICPALFAAAFISMFMISRCEK